MEYKNHADLHLHSGDLQDSDNKPEEVAKRIAELGKPGFALTQHGVFSGIENMKRAADKYGLKFIPGVEAFFDMSLHIQDKTIKKNAHLLMLSKNDVGYLTLCRAGSDKRAQNDEGKTVFNFDLLEEYFAEGTDGHGNVIVQSACINGVLAIVLRINEILEDAIKKVQRKMVKTTERINKNIESINKEFNKNRTFEGNYSNLAALLFEEWVQATEARKTASANAAEYKRISDKKFVRERSRLEKLINSDDVMDQAEVLSLKQIIAEGELAKGKLIAEKELIATLKKEVSYLLRLKNLFTEAAEIEAEDLKQIENFRNQFMSEDEINAEVKDVIAHFIKIFGKENFYIEIQNHGIDMEADIYPKLVKIARELKIPLVATNDVHTVTNSESELRRRQILRSMRFDRWEELQPGDDQLYIKTDEEMEDWLGRIFPEDVVTEAMNNIDVIFNQCNVKFESGHHYPVFPCPEGQSTETVFRNAVIDGANFRFPNGIPQEVKDRINYEYKIIRDMGYIDYHLVVKDFLEYGRVLAPVPDEFIDEAPLDIEEAKAWVQEHGWKCGFTIGPGRGSAAGSMICYCLGITSINPLEHGLIFERFLNPERISMPDIDSDIAFRIRPKVIEYVRHKYGEESVVGIATTNSQAPRGAIRIAAKYYGQAKALEINADLNKTEEIRKHFLALADKMAKFVPKTPGISFDSNYGNSNNTVAEAIKVEFKENKDALEILEWAKDIEGCFTAYGAHAAGIVISDGKPVRNYLPLRWNEKLGEMTTQVDMVQVEEKGLLKFDFLGLRTLDLITDALRLINDRYGIVIDPLQIPLDDADVFKNIYQAGKTNSVFQFESAGMKSMLKRFKPDSFEDLIILVSMFRPGPLQFLNSVIAVKTGKSQVSYLCSQLESILGKTYGSIVYQEQVMEIFQKLAGYTLGGADEVRRYMSKKKMEKLVAEKDAFINGDESRGIKGCVANGISAEVADTLFEQMTDFAKYAFNKSHAAAYSFISYITAYIKYHYPAQFFASAMKWIRDQKQMTGLVSDARSFGIEVLPPDVNESGVDFSVTKDGNIRFALSSIKGVVSVANEIVNSRKEKGNFVSLPDFFRKTSVNKGALESLARAGVFDCFGHSRKAVLAFCEEYKTLSMKVVTEEQQKALLKHLDNIEINDDLKDDINEKLFYEKKVCGSYITGHPTAPLKARWKQLGHKTIPELKEFAIENPEQLKATKGCMCVINKIELKSTKRGEFMAILEVEDDEDTMEAIVFPKVYAENKSRLVEGALVRFEGRLAVEERDEDVDVKYYPSIVKSKK